MTPRYIFFKDENDVGTLLENFKDKSHLVDGGYTTTLRTHENHESNKDKWWIRNSGEWERIALSLVPKKILTTMLLRGE